MIDKGEMVMMMYNTPPAMLKCFFIRNPTIHLFILEYGL